MIARLSRLLRTSLGVMILMLLTPGLASAHEAPDDGAEWVMADWMLLIFLVFFLTALTAFLVAFKRGLFYHLEDAKYHILTIDEPDYYTPEWAKEDMNATDL